MNNDLKSKLIEINKQLIEESSLVVSTKFTKRHVNATTHVNAQDLYRWWGKVKSFAHQLGNASKPWHSELTTDPGSNTLYFVTSITGILEAILYELENDHLSSFSELVKASTLADLLEQADTLFESGYHIASGVIARAVLEEHLRNLCETMNCTPEKKRPTINDYNQALYRAEHYSKVKLKHIDSLAAIGNDAAHNNQDLDVADIKRLINEIPNVIDSTSI